jgi:hypothetical protein
VTASVVEPDRDGRVASRRLAFLRVPLVCAVLVSLFALAQLVPRVTGVGPEMDEGALVAYADRALDGTVPHRDFLTFYGPANVWLVAGAFAVAGPSVHAERVVGLVYRLLIVLGLFVLAWRIAGALAGTLAGVISTLLLADDVAWAYATFGALGFTLLGLALATLATVFAERWRTPLYAAAGVAAAVAVLIRPDFAPAVVLSALPLALLAARRRRLWYGGAFVATSLVWVPHLLIVGWGRLDRLLGDLRASSEGRSLPIEWRYEYQVTMLVVSASLMILLLIAGSGFMRRPGHRVTGRILLSAGLLIAGLYPWVLSRADALHLKPVAVLSLALLPAVVLLGISALNVSRRLRAVAAVAVVAVTALLLADQFEVRRPVATEAVRNADGRAFYPFSTDPVGDVAAVVRRAEELSRPGDSLYVGPRDLRRMNYGPSYLYFLLPELEPASYYMEMNPLTANREGSGLADELRAADWLILTTQWDDWDEPNASVEYGPDEPNEVVRDLFCLRLRSGEYRLYERCDRGAA